MARFRHGHATHPQALMAAEIALAQVLGSAPGALHDQPPSLGFLYVTDHYAAGLPALLALLRERTGVGHWVGAVASSICANGVEYSVEPALALMLADLAPGSFTIFSGKSRLPAPGAVAPDGTVRSHTALVHGDPSLPELSELVQELSQRTASGAVFGALTSGHGEGFSQVADEPMAGGLSGAMFSPSVGLRTRVTQGCAPIAGSHVITDCDAQYVRRLDGRPALDVLLEDLGVRVPPGGAGSGQAVLNVLPAERLRQGLFVGLAPGHQGRKPGFGDFLVRNVVGIDPHNRLLAIADIPTVGDQLVFCTRNADAARRDLVRIVSELRGEVEDEGLTIRGALYHSCVARGASLFGNAGAELEIIAHHLGDIALVGMYGNGEIAHDRIYAYTGVLTLFVEPAG